MTRKTSLLKKETTIKREGDFKVQFLEDGIKKAKQTSRGFSASFFMHHIDKFFSRNMNVVIHPIDDEYEQYLKKQEEDKKELQKTIEELDDFFF